MHELLELADNAVDFNETDIIERNDRIMDTFIEYLYENNLMQ